MANEKKHTPEEVAEKVARALLKSPPKKARKHKGGVTTRASGKKR